MTDHPHRTAEDPRRVVGVVLGVTAPLGLLLLAFALPATHSEPRDVPLGVVGPDAAVAQVEQRAAGFAVTTYADEQAAREAVLDREVYGALVLGPDGVTTLTASAASATVAQVVTQVGSGIATATGAEVVVEDVRAFPDDDPRGAGLAAGALPLALGGFIGAMAISSVVRRPGVQAAALAAFAVTAGLTLTAILQFVLGTLDGSFWLASLGGVLGVAAPAATVLGLRTLLGTPGVVLAAVTIMLVGNPLSGLTSAPEMLPTPWGALGQLLPPGATGTLLRNLAFFDGAATLAPALVLTGWLVLGAALFAAGVARRRTTLHAGVSPAHAG